MLLVLDVGNTNTVLGVYELESTSGKPKDARLAAHWRVATIRTHTVDEYGVLFRNLFSIGGIEVSDAPGIIISPVVPPRVSSRGGVGDLFFKKRPLLGGRGIRTGL